MWKDSVELNIFNNNTNKITLAMKYPDNIDAQDADLLDYLIVSETGFNQDEIIEVTNKDGNLYTYTFTEKAKSFWLSQATLIPKEMVKTQTESTYDIKFQDKVEKLISFYAIYGEDVNFGQSDIILKKINNEEEILLTLVKKAEIDPKDVSDVLALRHAMDNTTIEIEGNETNEIIINVKYPTFGSKLSNTLKVDYLISFRNTLPKNTEIVIKVDEENDVKVILEENTKHIWFSDLVKIARRTLKDIKSETIKISFVYNQMINVKALTADLQNFNLAHIVVNQSVYGLFMLYDTKTLVVIPITVDDLKINVIYNRYTSDIESASIDLQNGQFVNCDFVYEKDEYGTVKEKYIRISHQDDAYKVSVDLIMNFSGFKNYLKLIRDMGAQLLLK